MQEYPKALYIGDQKQHQQVIAHDAEHESELRDSGHVDHLDLPEFDGSNVIDVEDLAQKLADTEKQLALAQSKHIEFRNDVSAMQARIEAIESGTGDTSPVDYNDLTSEQLRAILTEQGKVYKARDLKPELIALLVG